MPTSNYFDKESLALLTEEIGRLEDRREEKHPSDDASFPFQVRLVVNGVLEALSANMSETTTFSQPVASQRNAG